MFGKVLSYDAQILSPEDGKSIYLEDAPERIIDLLKDARQPMFLPQCVRPGRWLLPEWFHPDRRDSALTYHGGAARWQRSKAGVILDSAYRGQEFVLNCDHYPEAINWIRELLVLATV
jgi:hypothetical protein